MRFAIIPEHELQELLEEAADRVLRRAHQRPASQGSAPTPSTNPQRWLSTGQVTKYTGLSRSSLYRLRKSEALVPEKVNGRVVYDREVVDGFLSGTQGHSGSGITSTGEVAA